MDGTAFRDLVDRLSRFSYDGKGGRLANLGVDTDLLLALFSLFQFTWSFVFSLASYRIRDMGKTCFNCVYIMDDMDTMDTPNNNNNNINNNLLSPLLLKSSYSLSSLV
jgi:hypothetical protein